MKTLLCFLWEVKIFERIKRELLRYSLKPLRFLQSVIKSEILNCVVLFSFANGIKHIFIICELFFAEYELDFEKLLIRYPDADFVGGYVSLAKIFLQPKISSNSIKIWHFWPKKRYKRFWNFKILSFRKDYSQKEKQICEKYMLCVN